ncbi:hypothetical protein FHS60_002059 [Alloprevotella rava]|uniref:Uncharacterized protein n=1 Tax=Alloprevotella rava TaxID=671218 RepID=A0A7W5XYG2_9BACT|nr:hypothetical protein [Alloprevotella rava]
MKFILIPSQNTIRKSTNTIIVFLNYLVHPRIALVLFFSYKIKAVYSLSLWLPNLIRNERQLIISGIWC